MITTAIFPGRYVQGRHALNLLGEHVALLGRNALLVCDPFATNSLGRALQDSFANVDASGHIEEFGKECCDFEIERLVAIARKSNHDVIVGIGGGKALDTAKAVAWRLNCRCISAPTLASTDAPCSALSVIYTDEGAFQRYEVLPHNPDIVLVDTQLCADAPTRFLVAGMGDALATWYEAEDCRIRRGTNMTGRPGPMSAYGLASLCKDILLEYGEMARISCDESAVTPALEHVVEANTLLSGLGFESGGLAAAHAIHNGLTALAETHQFWHGEKVAIGLQAMLIMTDRPSQVVDTVFDFCAAIGLPTTLAQIGLERTDRARLFQACVAACAEGETIHNEPYEVSPAIVLDALITADAEGRRRQGKLATEPARDTRNAA